MIAQNIPLAVVLQVFGSFCFALAAKYQHRTIDYELDGNPEKHVLSCSELWNTIRDPHWLGGLGLICLSFFCQITALIFAPVSIVQPIGLLAFPWSILIQHRAEHRRLSRKLIAWVCMTVLTTGLFTLIVSRYVALPEAVHLYKVAIGIIAVYLICFTFGLLGWKGRKQLRALFWGSGGAMLYGLEAALVKALLEYAQLENVLRDPAFWVIVIVLVLGSLTAGWMVQQGYATGKADIVVAAMTITSPVVAVIYGIAVLGEGTGIPVFSGFVMIICAFIALGGVVEITRLRSAQGRFAQE